jgi:DnaJ like chaperone protein
MGAIKWIGGVLGWTLGGGVIGGILGYALGSLVDNAISGNQVTSGNFGTNTDRGYQGSGGDFRGSNGPFRGQRPVTQPGDFGVSLLILSAAVMKSDKQVLKSELDFVKEFFKRQFGTVKAENYILTLRELLKQEYNLRDVCQEIKFYMDHASRLQLLHFLYGLSLSDGHAHPDELITIRSIASWLGISTVDTESIQAMFIKNTVSAYKILEINAQATDEEVRKAYKRMAVKHHPDKVSHLGEDVQKAANEKFKEINQAFDRIKKERGMN